MSAVSRCLNRTQAFIVFFCVCSLQSNMNPGLRHCILQSCLPPSPLFDLGRCRLRWHCCFAETVHRYLSLIEILFFGCSSVFVTARAKNATDISLRGKMKNGFHARMPCRRVKAIFQWKPRPQELGSPRQSAIEVPVCHVNVEAYCENKEGTSK